MTSQQRKQALGFLSTFWGTAVRPWRTLGALAEDAGLVGGQQATGTYTVPVALLIR